LNDMNDKNDRISYLRAKSIQYLTTRCVDIYQSNFEAVLRGDLTKPLFDIIRDECDALKHIIDFSIKHIYNHRAVVEIENAGYNVMYRLLSHFIPSVLLEEDKRLKSDKKAVKLIPNQFLYEHDTPYKRVMGVLDYVSGMTDNYATDLYRKIQGIEIGMTI